MAGCAFVYFGSETVENEHDLILSGQKAEDRFGYSVSSAGDVNTACRVPRGLPSLFCMYSETIISSMTSKTWFGKG